MSEYSDRLKGVGFLSKKGQTNTTFVRDEDTGRVAGRHIQHWNDRQDAVVTPETLKVHFRVEEG